jgi:hypothetical protein
VVDPHFTLVFPIGDVDRAILGQHVREQARSSKKILWGAKTPSVPGGADVLASLAQAFVVDCTAPP